MAGALGAAVYLLVAATTEAAVVSYQKGDGKGVVSETDDATLEADTPGGNFGTDIVLNIDNAGPHAHGVVSFPNIFGSGANQIPPGSSILSATLTMYVENPGNSSNCPIVYQLRESFVEAQVTWSSRATALPWTDPGADGTTSRNAVPEGTIACSALGATNLSVTTSVQAWSNGEPNYGWVFVNQTGSDDGIDFTSSEGTSAQRPLLTVTFAPAIFYSVGINTGDLKAGSPTIAIAGGVATFSVPQPDNIGVGDEVLYGAGLRAFISGRTSSTVYSLQTNLGVPAGNAPAGTSVTSIKRAFNTLKDAALSSDTAAFLGTADLVANGFQLNWPCYADGPDPSHYVRIEEPWITGPGNYIRAYTPTDPSEVGVSQRHTGVAGTGYRIAPTGPAAIDFFNFILVSTQFGQVRIEGLEIDGSGLTQGENVRGLMANQPGGVSDDVRFTHNLIHDITNTTIDDSDNSRVLGIFLDDTTNSKVANNVIYNLTSVSASATGQVRGIEGNDPGKVHHVYNNTLYNLRQLAAPALATGILDTGGSTIFARNNYVGLVDNAAGGEACFSGTFAAASNNVSSDATAPGAGSQTGRSSYAAYFVSTTKGSEDLHLLGDSNDLWGSYGADLDGDPTLPVTDDFEGEARSATTPDIGADEFATPAVFYSVGTSTADLKTGTPTITIAAGLATLSAAQTNDVGVGDVIDYDSPSRLAYISAVVSPTQFRVLSASGTVPSDVPGPGVGVNSIKRAFNSIASAAASSLLPAYLGSGDLTAVDRRLTWVCYDDGPFDVSATTTISGYTTDAGHFITLTVAGASQVATGNSQRHRGVEGTGARMNRIGGGAATLLLVGEAFTRIEWLELDGNDVATTNGVVLSAAADRSLVRNLLVHHLDGTPGSETTTATGVLIDTGNDSSEVRNSIVYAYDGDGVHVSGTNATVANCTFYLGRTAPSSNSVQTDNAPASATVYNVLAVGPETDFWENSAGGLSLHNCVSTDTSACDFDVSGSCRTGVQAVNEFISLSGTLNLHLRGGADAIDFGRDLSTSFVDDVDGQLRPSGAGWDAGADETFFSGATTHYRSVGITASNLNTGSLTVTISGWTATFSGPMPDNVGVGDALTYVSGGNRLAFIVGRSSPMVFSVANKDGAQAAAASNVSVGVYRAYNRLADWENGIENPNIVEPVENDVNPSPDLVTANSVMMVACYADGEDIGSVYINSWQTGPDNYIRIYTPVFPTEVGTSQRHNGAWDDTAYRLSQDASYFAVIGVRERYVRIDGLQLNTNQIVSTESNGIHAGDSNGDLPVELHFSNNIVRSTTAALPNVAFGIGLLSSFGSTTLNNSLYVAKVWNNVVYGYVGASSSTGIYAAQYGTLYAYNNTVVGTGPASHRGIAQFNNTIVHAKNNISINSADPYAGTGYSVGSTNNFSDLGDAPGLNPKTRDGAGADPVFVGGVDYHLHPSDTWARDQGADLSGDANLPLGHDIDLASRQVPWDIGVDDLAGTTAVVLQSFVAVPADAAVELQWRTASELTNLGFHLYRGPGPSGPWTRVTSSLIPGLGSSAVGRSYSWRDAGLVNGERYHYLLEDVDASSKTTSHGPVSAVPQAALPAPSGRGSGDGSDTQRGASAGCPAWLLAAYGAGASAEAGPLRCTRHGDPEAISLHTLSRDSRSVTLELRTGGFYALHAPPGAGEAAGTVRVFVPGFDVPRDEAAAIPVRRALVEAVVGRRVELGGVRALDVVGYQGLVPSLLGQVEMQVGSDGTVRAGRRGARRIESRRSSGRLARSELVTLLPSLFQGEKKSALVELAPLRFDERRGQLVLARRLRVRLLFSGREPGESGRGSMGRAPRRWKPAVSGELLARLYTTSRGLHAVAFEQLFAGERRGVAASGLRLQRQGEPVGFHVEPATGRFGPGSWLYFHTDAVAGSTDFSGELAFELVSSSDGLQMPLASAAPGLSAVVGAPWVTRSFETNRFYQPGLIEAADPWLWEALPSGATRVVPFDLSRVDPAAGAELAVLVQGASESGSPVDHHLSVSLNGVLLGEARFAGKRPYRIRLSMAVSLLREGANELRLTSLADTGVSSLVFLDRFEVSHPQLASLTSGALEGTWHESGTATLTGAPGAVALLDVTETPRWLTGHESSGGALRFQVEAGRRYRVVPGAALLSPRVAPLQPSGLRNAGNQADYLLIAPQAFLAAAEPLVERRRDQGLSARAVAFEAIAAEFGHGQPSAEAIQAFLAYAFHSWARPSPRYVVLLGDSSYDPRNFTGNAQPSPLPALWTRTSFLWTVSDPRLAAVNGEDPLPDLAIGRLPATTVEQAQALVAKLVAWEDSGQGLSGRATLVADNPDVAGDFEADVRDIAESYLADRNPQQLRLRELGAQTRPRILAALDSGLSFLSYVGHGGAAVWASENVWNSWDAASLQAQSRQPLLVTMNCLNGYFVAPAFESLAESLLKAEGRGAIASFTPSGLSLDGPAHQYHRALMAELTGGGHERLGDALLAAQQAYAATGLMPELISVYHLLGDPATPLGSR